MRVTSAAGCTIISPNYLAYARTLARSYLRQHPGQRFFVLIVADLASATPFAGEGFEAVLLSEIGLGTREQMLALAMQYDILELNTNVKPTFLKHLFDRYGFEQLVYLDPDIFCYAPMTPVLDALADHDAVLTPHLTAPIEEDGKSPTEQDMLYNGTYNLGFIGLRNSPEARRLLDWWEQRCLTNAFSEGRTGLFVDQKWMNLAPGLFEGIAILRDAGCNMAYWNLHERTLSGPADAPIVNGSALLRFFHFSGVVASDSRILSKNSDRFRAEERPDLEPIFAAYRAAILAGKDATLESLPYGFNAFSDGTAVTQLARRIYAKHRARWADEDPFDASGSFASIARCEGLVKGPRAPEKERWSDFNPRDRRVGAVHALLKVSLRVLGPHRYELLMRYLSFITVLRNQSVFLGNQRDGARSGGAGKTR